MRSHRHELRLRARRLGSCTVLLDDEPLRSCLMFAVQAQGRKIRTVEGLARGDRLHTLQRAFIDHHALQCGFCTPGFLMLAVSVLERDPEIGEAELREALSANLCRCTGYKNIVKAVEAVSQMLGNTPSICRKCYVHPAVLEAYMDGVLVSTLRHRAEERITTGLRRLRPEEAAVLAFLQRRLVAEQSGRNGFTRARLKPVLRMGRGKKSAQVQPGLKRSRQALPPSWRS